MLGEAVKKIRIAHLMTQREFAAFIGSSHQAISQWESGSRVPRYPTIKKLMRFAIEKKIKVRIEDFLT